jgi:hypothetical protein
MKRLLALSILAFALVAAPASARLATPLEYDGFVDGSDAVGVSSPSFNGVVKAGFDQASGTLYATTSESGGRIYKFDAGTLQSEPFGELAPNTVISPQQTDVASGFTVDNSGTETQSRIYAFAEFASTINVYKPGGKLDEDVNIEAQGDDCGAAVGPDGHLWIAIYNVGAIEYLPDGEKTGKVFVPQNGPHENTPEMCDFAIDSQGNFYAPESYLGGFIKKYSSAGTFQYKLGKGNSTTVAIDRRDDSVYVDDRSTIEKYSSGGSLLDEFGAPESSSAPCPTVIEEAGNCYNGLSGSEGITVDETTGNVYATNAGFPQRVDVFTPGPPVVAADVTTDLPVPTPTSALLRGTLNPSGVATTACRFEWGAGSAGPYEHQAACAEGDVFDGSDDQHVTAEISGLTLGSTYHAALVVENANGILSYGLNQVFTAQGKPILGRVYVNELNTDGGRLNAEIDPHRGPTTYRFEYGTDSSYGTVVPLEEVPVPTASTVSQLLKGLSPGTEYHYRVVATNLAGESPSADHTFSTFPQVPVIVDNCPNALSRQQTSAALMPDCRSYELASAIDSGGYNVESDLVPRQQPLDGPVVDGRLLYGVHNGGIPGSGNPTNNGVDPYLAVRGEDGWTTRYVGVPANETPSIKPFASTLLATDDALDAFAFGGPEICAPCFADGSGGIPVRGRDGTLTQGMAGDLDGGPAARPDGLVVEPMSADGSHFVFGSTTQFESDGNDQTGDVSIYSRDLETGETQVVSKTPAGTNLTCLQGAGACHSPADGDGIAELAISRDGSRVVVAQRISTDGDGNRYWHPFMHIGTSSQTVDLAPGTTSGVLFDGMTEDGSRVYFTTRDQLSTADTDSSADIYVDEVGGGGTVVPELVSVTGGGPSNSDSCHPVTDWNTVSGGPNCDAVAFAGGAGVAADEGSIYFVSPELLDGGGNGVEDQANLYLARPGHAPRFVTTIDTSVGKPAAPPPSREVIQRELIKELSTPEALAVDQSNGDIYVAERETQSVSRFTASGDPHPFTAGTGAGTNRIQGQSFGFGAESQLAVDNHAGSPFENDLYVTSRGSTISVYANSGAKLGTLTGFSYACGVAVDQSNGDVYVADYYAGLVRLRPTSNSQPSFDENYERTRVQTRSASAILRPCQVAADAGDVFASGFSGGPVLAYSASQFQAAPGPEIYGELVSTLGNTVAMDSSTNELLVNTGGRIDLYSASGELEEELARGEIGGSRGLAVNGGNHHVYAVNGSSVVEIGYQVSPYEPIDNPAVVHGVRESGVHRFGDFQVSPDGHFAAFPSSAPITSFDSFGHLEVYRYDAEAGSTICASCAPTNSQATRDAVLPAHGNAMTLDGRVFFNSDEPLVLRDTNGKTDAYEWKDGEVFLISSGTSPFAEGMLSVSRSGRDAYFFTRDSLAPEDQNGSLMRIYDAREGGGFFHIPAPPPCAASDECHGPGSRAAAPAEVASLGGTEGNAVAPQGKKRCKAGFVKKHGKCVKKHRKRHHRRHNRRRGGR